MFGKLLNWAQNRVEFDMLEEINKQSDYGQEYCWPIYIRSISINPIFVAKDICIDTGESFSTTAIAKTNDATQLTVTYKTAAAVTLYVVSKSLGGGAT